MRGKAGTVSGRTLDGLNRRIELRQRIEDALHEGITVYGGNCEKAYDKVIRVLIALDEAGLEIVRKRKTTIKEG